MNIRTRHMALLTYAGLAAIVFLKDLVTDINGAVMILAPITGMFVWDKIRGTKTT